MTPFLEVEDLVVEMRRHGAAFRAVKGVSFSLERGDALALVGESGCGKSLTLRAIMGLLPNGGRSLSGRVAPRRCRAARCAVRGRGRGHHQGERMSIVFQDALERSQPRRDGRQPDRRGATTRPRPRPQRLSGKGPRTAAPGGDPRSRASLRRLPARAVGRNPPEGHDRHRLVVRTRHPVVRRADDSPRRHDPDPDTRPVGRPAGTSAALSLVFVTHDLSVVGQVAEQLAVMYTGRLVETGPTATVLAEPRHPYTAGLLAAALDVDTPGPRTTRHPGLDPGPVPAAERLHLPSPLRARHARMRA